MEAVRLRVKDVELSRHEIVVRDGKGGKDTVTMLPESLLEPLRAQLALRRVWHDQDILLGKVDVWLPDALAVKYPNASKEWGWQYVFAAKNYSIDPRSQAERRHHFEEKQVQRYVKKPRRRRASSSRLHRTRCAIRLQHMCCRPVTTSARCRSCSVIVTSPLP